MAATLDIQDEASPLLNGLPESIRTQAAPAVGAAVVDLFQQNFKSLPPNRYGFPSTGFWADCARSTNFRVVTDGPLISVNKQGMRQRLMGGPISRQDGGNLAWGIAPDTYGVRARQYMSEHPEARIAFRRVGGQVKAIGIENLGQTASVIERKKRGQGFRAVASLIGRVLVYKFAKSVNQQPDPRVIPGDTDIRSVSFRTIDGVVSRAIARGGAA